MGEGEEGAEMSRSGPVEGDWNATRVWSGCRPYLFPLIAFEALFLLYAENLRGVVVDGRRFRLRLRFGASRACGARLSYSVWEGEPAGPGGEAPLLVRRVLWDRAADWARQSAYARSVRIGDRRSGMNLFGLWPDLSLDSALLGPGEAGRLAGALARAEGALRRAHVLSEGADEAEGGWDDFSLEGAGAPGAPSRLLRWWRCFGNPDAEDAVLHAMEAADRELARCAPRPVDASFEYAFPPEDYRFVLAGPNRLAPGAGAHARAQLGAGERPVERVCGSPAAEGRPGPGSPPGPLARAFAFHSGGPAAVVVGYEGEKKPALCGQVMGVALGEPGGPARSWHVYRGERGDTGEVLVVRRTSWERAADPRRPGAPTVEVRGAVVPEGRAGALGDLLARAEAVALAGPGEPGGPDGAGVEVGVMRRPDWGEASFGARVPEGSAAARFAREAARALDLELDRSGREECSVELDYVLPPEGFLRPRGGLGPCDAPPPGAAPEGRGMRMYGSSPRDPGGGMPELDSAELGSCRIVLDGGDAQELLALLDRARLADGAGAACRRLRSGRPARLEHGDAGQPDLVVHLGPAGEGGAV